MGSARRGREGLRDSRTARPGARPAVTRSLTPPRSRLGRGLCRAGRSRGSLRAATAVGRGHTDRCGPPRGRTRRTGAASPFGSRRLRRSALLGSSRASLGNPGTQRAVRGVTGGSQWRPIVAAARPVCPARTAPREARSGYFLPPDRAPPPSARLDRVRGARLPAEPEDHGRDSQEAPGTEAQHTPAGRAESVMHFGLERVDSRYDTKSLSQ